MQTLNNTGIWSEVYESTESSVVRSSRWPHFAISVTTSTESTIAAWMTPTGPGLIEEVATTLERFGVAVTFERPAEKIRFKIQRLKGRWYGWRNVSRRSRLRGSGLAEEGTVLSNTLEVLSDSAPRYASWLGRNVLLGTEDFILEVGAGTGTMTAVLCSSSAVVAFEPSPDARRQLIVRTQDQAHVQVVESLDECRQRGPFDTAILINVLEHIDHDVDFLASLKSLCAPEGRVVVLSPAHNCLYSDFDASVGHVRRYNRATMKKTLETAGFEDVTVRYFNAVGAILWLLVNRLLKRKTATSRQTRLYDNVVVPVSALVDRLGIRPFGQSAIGSGRVN